jgi:hypothetical protein
LGLQFSLAFADATDERRSLAFADPLSLLPGGCRVERLAGAAVGSAGSSQLFVTLHDPLDAVFELRFRDLAGRVPLMQTAVRTSILSCNLACR